MTLISDKIKHSEIIDTRRLSCNGQEVLYSAIDLNIGDINLSRRFDSKYLPLITCYRLSLGLEDKLQIELLIMQVQDEGDAKELASPVPDLNLYLIYQTDAVVMWKYKCKMSKD